MNYSQADINEARRLAEQAQAQVESQAAMILRMRASGLSTEVAEGAMRTMTIIRDQMLARLEGMLGVAKGDDSSIGNVAFLHGISERRGTPK